jgi:hypothetical protein
MPKHRNRAPLSDTVHSISRPEIQQFDPNFVAFPAEGMTTEYVTSSEMIVPSFQH